MKFIIYNLLRHTCTIMKQNFRKLIHTSPIVTRKMFIAQYFFRHDVFLLATFKWRFLPWLDHNASRFKMASLLIKWLICLTSTLHCGIYERSLAVHYGSRNVFLVFANNPNRTFTSNNLLLSKLI